MTGKKEEIKITIDDQEYTANFREFSTGKKGYGLYGTITINGRSYRISCNLIQMGG